MRPLSGPSPLYSLLVKNRGRGAGLRASGNEVLIDDVIVATDVDADWWGGVSAQAFAKTLRGLTGDLTIRINSPGGDVFAATAMKQAIAEYDGSITAQVDGLAASATSVIAVACEKVVMAPGSMMMIHKAWTLGVGNADDMRQTAEILEKADAGISAAYAAKSGGDGDYFLALMKAETWFTAEEAVAEGLADEALPETVDQRRTRASGGWDLSAFMNAPAGLGHVPASERREASAADVERLLKNGGLPARAAKTIAAAGLTALEGHNSIARDINAELKSDQIHRLIEQINDATESIRSPKNNG